MSVALRITCTDLPSASLERMNLHHLTSLFQVFGCLFVCSFLFLQPKIKMSYNLKKKKKTPTMVPPPPSRVYTSINLKYVLLFWFFPGTWKWGEDNLNLFYNPFKLSSQSKTIHVKN